MTEYRGFRITLLPKPIPLRHFDYDFWSPQSGDGGSGASEQDCKDQVDELLEHIASGSPDPTGG